MKRKVRNSVIMVTCVVMLTAFIIIVVEYQNSIRKSQIHEDLKSLGNDVEILKLEEINKSIIAIVKADDFTKYVIYDQFFCSRSYMKNFIAPLGQSDERPLTNGWHVYLVKISKDDICVQKVECWKGSWAERTLNFLISVLGVIIVIVIMRFTKTEENNEAKTMMSH